MTMAIELSELFRRDLIRLGQEIEGFGDEALLWKTMPGVSNSAGNLALHLEGNLREYVGRQMGGIAYERKRDLEFSGTGVPAADLVSRFRDLGEMVPGVIAGLSAEQLDGVFPENVLGIPLTTSKFLLHLYSHFNYHLGQIDNLRRVLTGEGAIAFARL